MPQNRLVLPGLLALLFLCSAAWQIYAGWGLVTLDVRDTPLSKVLATISRQGGIDLASNLDPTTPVTLKVKRVPPVEALDLVAGRADASWRLAYLGAPDQAAINTALANFRVGGETPGWTSYGDGGFSLVEPQSGAALDLRRVNWTPSAAGELPALLEEASQKTGVFLAAPADWKPSTAAPKPGPIARTAPRSSSATPAAWPAKSFSFAPGPRATMTTGAVADAAARGSATLRPPHPDNAAVAGCAPWATRSR